MTKVVIGGLFFLGIVLAVDICLSSPVNMKGGH